MMRQDDATCRNGFKSVPVSQANGTSVLLSDERFRGVLLRETKRSERSRKRLLLMLIDHGNPCEHTRRCRSLTQAAGALGGAIRETDIAGWFDAKCVLGVIFTEFGQSDVTPAVEAIEAKIIKSLRRTFAAPQLSKFRLSFYAFPDQQPAEDAAVRVRHQIQEPNASGAELLVRNTAVLQWSSRVAELCSSSQRLRLD